MNRFYLLIFACFFVITIFLSLSAGCASYPKSDHCDGNKFFNDVPGSSFSDHIKWFWEMETVEWPENVIDEPQPKPVPNVLPQTIEAF